MVTINKVENYITQPNGTFIQGELYGLSTDTKPTEMQGKYIANGSTFIEMDTGKIYLYDLENQEWKEI